MTSYSLKKKNTSQTRTAFILTCATLALVAVTTISVHTYNYVSGTSSNFVASRSSGDTMSRSTSFRVLEEDNNDNNNNEYSDQSCDDIFSLTEVASDERCQFAQQCNSNQGLQLSFIFCNTYNLSTTAWIAILSPVLIIWLVLLFRMLGSTAEEFFSPSLEMFSIKMGLPPRFAGVTLLALGNGAADVSATINAIVQNPAEGYQMSLGALTGAGMFVGTVVAGIVIVIADGVKCRGALVRDLLMFIITLGVVYSFFQTGQIGKEAIHTFLWMYVGFVAIVLTADVYHRAIVLPRMRRKAEEERLMEEETNDESAGESSSDDKDAESTTSTEDDRKVTFAPPSGDSGDVELAKTRMGRSNNGEFTNVNTSSLMAPDNNQVALSATGTSQQYEEEFFVDDPTELDGSKTKKKLKKIFGKKKKKKGKLHKVQKGVDTIMMALSNYAPEEGTNTNKSFKGWSEGLEVTTDAADTNVKLHGVHGILSKKSSEAHEELDDDSQEGGRASGPSASYRVLLENVDNMCTVDGATSSGLNIPWGVSLSQAWHEFTEHFVDYYKDIFANEENNKFDKFFLVCELPFTFLRKLSVPIPCEDYYCRGLVAAAVALAPLWFGVYCVYERNTNLFYTGGSPVIEVVSIFTVLVALLVAKFAPAEENEMSLMVSVPIAFIGFIMAATWIDTIADQLVRLLTLLGVICGIPGSIMGITILAWGNSMGDLSANMTMAKKGLANMAITACFAGPVFNILIGLGGGFTKLNTSTGVEYTEVELIPPITVGFIFLAVNCILVLAGGLVWNRGHIPKGYGYVAVALYVAYVVLSVWLQFQGGDAE